MHLVIASFAIVILAIAILFSNRYEFIGNGKQIYRLDNFTGKIEKIEDTVIIKLDKKFSVKKVNDYKRWKEYSDNNITAVLETKYIDETLFIKLLIIPKKTGINFDKVKVSFYDKEDFLILQKNLDNKLILENQLVFFGIKKLQFPLYLLINQWKLDY